jgi:hypothetical protein
MEMKRFFILLLACFGAWAADVSGTWTLTYKTENGFTRTARLELKSEGSQLTGSITSDRGTARIEQGKVEGDAISFDLVRKGNGDEIVVHYEGRIENGGLGLRMQYGRRAPVSVTGVKL